MKNTRFSERGSARTVALALVSFFLGVALSAWWLHPPGGSGKVPNTVPESTSQAQIGLPAPPPAPAPPESHPQPIDPAVIAEVKQEVPDYSSIPLQDGEQILRSAALKDFAAATKQMDAQMSAAQQQLQDAENTRSEAEQQAAMKHVQETQMEAAETLKEIGARLQSQIAALKSLKSGQ